MSQHLGADLLEQYVIGALDADSVRFVEGHVAQCPACARLLQAEARVEVALHELAARGRVVSLDGRRRRVRAVVASVAAALAAGLMLGFFAGGAPPAGGSPSLRRCDDRHTAQECLSRAQFDGVLTIGPGGEPVVPRYDLTPGAQP
ncbi:MAG: anti-sigma factor family protein [Myxococcota bacterium]